MPKTKRTQILMDPSDFDRLQAIAEARGVSVAELIRQSVQEKYLPAPESRASLLGELFALNIPWTREDDDWEAIEKEIEEGHEPGLF